MPAPVDPKKLAAAKLSVVLAVSLDHTLPKIAPRIIGVFVGRHMRAEHGGVAYPSVSTICATLNVSTGSMVRAALNALVAGQYLVAERKAGATTTYRIAPHYFDRETQPVREAASGENELGGAPIGEAGGAPIGEATKTVNINPVIEDRNPSLLPSAPQAESAIASDDAAAPSADESEAFRRFERAWVSQQGESRKAARRAFERLSEQEREAAIQGAGAFQGAMAGRQHRPHASTYLAEGKWNFFSRPSPPASPRLEPRVMAQQLLDGRWRLHPDSEQLRTWREHELATLGRAPRGFDRPNEWPPAACAPVDELAEASGAAR